jgi:hypothetical protein
MNTNKCFLLILLTIAVIGFTGCEKYRKGCWERKELLLGSTTYLCNPVKDMSDFSNEPKGEEILEPYGTNDWKVWYVFYEDESCAALGYKQKENLGYYNKDGSDTPGKNSYWASDNPDPDDPNTPAFCTGYVSPCTDPQVNPFCESAYNARCILGVPATDVRVTEPCIDYAGFQQLNPAIADCSYCE